jgi:hypothetical protein
LVKPKEVSLFDTIPYVKIDDPVIDKMVDDTVEDIRGHLVKNSGNKVYITLQKSVKKKGWFGTTEEKTGIETWNLPLYVTEYDKSFSSEHRDQLLSKRIHQLMERLDDTPLLLTQGDDYTLFLAVNEPSAHSPVKDLFELIKNGPPKFF